MVIHFLATGERLFQDHFVRCSDTGSDGLRVIVGGFDSGGFHVIYYWDVYRPRRGVLALASSRRF